MNTQNNNNHTAILETETETIAEAPLQPNAAESGCLSPRERAGVSGKSASKLTSDSDPSAKPHFSRLPHIKPPRRLTGKVARLPHVVRTLVNTMLNDGASYSTIVRRLTELGHPGFTTFSVCRWRKGGYEDWLAAQEKFDLEKLRAESTAEAIKEFKDPSAFQDASERLAALNIFRALRELDLRPPADLLNNSS